MARATVSEPAEHALDAWLAWLLEGKIRIQDLPLCVAAWFHAGEAAGRASRDLELQQLEHEVQQLEREVNRWYYLANTTPAQRRDDIEARLATALDQATEHQWQQLDRDLSVMAGHPQLNNGTTTFDPANRAEIEGTNGRSSGTTGAAQQAA